VSDDSESVDNVGASEGDSLVFSLLNETSVLLSDALGDVRNEGDIHLAEASLLSVFLGVLHVGELGVDGASKDFTVGSSEFSSSVRELDDLGGAHEGEVEWVEEEDDVFTSVLGELDLFEAIVVGLGSKLWGSLSDCSNLPGGFAAVVSDAALEAVSFAGRSTFA
jgi:hypothetical protein